MAVTWHSAVTELEKLSPDQQQEVLSQVLQETLPAAKRDLSIDEIRPLLYQNGVITSEEATELLGIFTGEEKITRLYTNILPKKGMIGLKKFMEILLDTGCDTPSHLDHLSLLTKTLSVSNGYFTIYMCFTKVLIGEVETHQECWISSSSIWKCRSCKGSHSTHGLLRVTTRCCGQPQFHYQQATTTNVQGRSCLHQWVLWAVSILPWWDLLPRGEGGGSLHNLIPERSGRFESFNGGSSGHWEEDTKPSTTLKPGNIQTAVHLSFKDRSKKGSVMLTQLLCFS